MCHEEVPKEQILKSCKIDRRSLDRWVLRWNKGGYEAIVNQKRAGRPTTLTAEQKEILKDYVLSNKSRIVCRELVELVQEKWGIKCNNHLCKSFPELEETVSRILFELQNHKFIAGQ
jgi:transposase